MGITQGIYERTRRQSLPKEFHVVKLLSEEHTEFFPIQLLDMIRITVLRFVGIGLTIRRRDDQCATRPQHPFDLLQHLPMFVMVLNSLKRHHNINRVIRQGYRLATADQERHVGSVPVPIASMRDACWVDIDPDHGMRGRRKYRGAITFTGSHI